MIKEEHAKRIAIFQNIESIDSRCTENANNYLISITKFLIDELEKRAMQQDDTDETIRREAFDCRYALEDIINQLESNSKLWE